MLQVLLAAIEPASAAASVESANQIVQIGQAFGVKWQLLLAQLINFAIVAFVLYRFVIKPTQDKLDERRKLIEDGLKRNEESAHILAQAQAQRDEIIQLARKEAAAMMDKSQKEAVAYETKQHEEAKRAAAEIIARAHTAAVQEQANIARQAEAQIAQLVVRVAESSLEESLSAEQKARFAGRMTEQLAGK